jgi:NifU-like protein involved in Fe-S cluster formation
MVANKTDRRAVVGAGQVGIPGQGPHMIIVIKAEHGTICQARFSTYGCPAANACGQFVCDEVENHTVEHATSIDEDSIVRSIGRMPLGREHCPGLAIGALKMALTQIEQSLKEE